MSDQQELVNRIVTLAIEISTAQIKFIDCSFSAAANQLQIKIVSRNGKTGAVDAIDLHEPGDAEVSRQRVLRNLLERVIHLESILRESSLTQQRRLLPR